MTRAATDTLRDALVIGGGPAGLTAALYLRRFRRDVLIVDAGNSRAAYIPQTHNLPGFPRGIGGTQLLRRMRKQLDQLEVQRVQDAVSALQRNDDRFIATVGARQLHARHVILATGSLDREPAVTGTHELRDAGLLRQCPVCDAFEFQGRRIAVLGHGAHGVKVALFLRHYSDDVVLVGPAAEEAESRNATHSQDTHSDLQRDTGTLNALALRPGGGAVLRFASGAERDADVVYSALGCHPRIELGVQLGANCEADGNLKVDAHQRTSVPGLYAAGDVTGGLDQIVVACAEAAVAATAIHHALMTD